ncbi:hypothetical protein EBN88_03475 [Streptomyces triticirhizae]|uniref:Uncharacterized protein n=2 Tax=Streptomyces triticirhizae TaxID=2483353 RepID=A0A3M2M6V6_9ACTN|nr:hypothetical protein EBN88_03475 [Streptomyces triticirhizae]
MVFFHVAPRNAVSQRYGEQIDAWVYPFFEQDWRLFAPNPASANVQISVKTRQEMPDGATRESDWFDLTALDTSAVRHHVFPSHTAQNTLRRAWSAYVDAHGAEDVPHSDRAVMLRDYLRNIAADRVAEHRPGPFDAVRLRVETVPIAAHGAQQVSPNAVETRDLPWWEVSQG